MYTVRLNNQQVVFEHVKDLRRFVIYTMPRSQTVTYDGHGRGYSHNRGMVFYKNGWKVRTDNALYSIKSDGSIKKIR